MTDITDVDTFTDPITHAINAGESINAADVNTAVQGLSNRTRNSKNRLDVIDTVQTTQNTRLDDTEADVSALKQYAVYSISGTTVASTNKLTLTLVEQVGGFSLSSDEIQVPAAGSYEISVKMHATADSTSDNILIGPNLDVAGSPHTTMTQRRFSTSIVHSVNCGGSTMVVVTTPSTDKINLVANVEGGGNLDVLGGGPRLIIRRLTVP